MDLLNEYESTLHFIESQAVGPISMALNKIETWENLDVKVNCTLTKRDHLNNIIQQHGMEKRKFTIFEWEL